MLECFENLVGSKACNSQGFARYIEELNISVKKLAGIANGSQITGAEYLASKLRGAVLLVQNEVQLSYEPIATNLANIQFTKDYNQTYNGMRGVLYRSKCNLSKLYIDTVLFKCNDTVNAKQLVITDGADVTTIEFDAVAGQVIVIPVNALFNNSEVRIEVDNTDIRTAQNKPYRIDCLYPCKDTQCLNGVNQTYGISVIGHYKCDDNLITCQLSKLDPFIESVLYKTGALILEDLEDGTQLNEVIITKNDNLEKRIDAFHHRSELFAETAKKSFNKLIENSCCFDCEKTNIINFSM